MARYWLVEVDGKYIANNAGEMTALKTVAGRVRDRDKDQLYIFLEESDAPPVYFVPTTYKPKTAKFIDPYAWLWMNCQQDRGW